MALQVNEYTSSDTYSDYGLSEKYSVFGGEDDLWGADEITLEQIQDPNFSIKFDTDLGAGRFRVDSVRVELFYILPGSGAQNATVYEQWSPLTVYALNEIIWAIASDGTIRQYQATTAGTSGSVQPTFGSIPGSVYDDGTVQWTEVGQYLAAEMPPYYASELLSGAIGRGPSGQRRFIVVGQKGVIKYSDDGQTWTQVESGVGNALRGVTAGPNGFIAVGDNGTILRSSGGVTWTKEESGTLETLFGVDYDLKNDSFTAVGLNGLIRKKKASATAWTAIAR